MSAGAGPMRCSLRRAQSLQRRLDHFDLFATQVARLARVRIQTQHEQARLRRCRSDCAGRDRGYE